MARRLQALCRTWSPAFARIWGGKRTRVVLTVRDVPAGGACERRIGDRCKVLSWFATGIGMYHRWTTLLFAVAVIYAPVARVQPNSELAAYGMTSRCPPKAYLNIPHTAIGKIPPLLSQTGAFIDTRHLIVSK